LFEQPLHVDEQPSGSLLIQSQQLVRSLGKQLLRSIERGIF
jgi:hypothetical protein